MNPADDHRGYAENLSGQVNPCTPINPRWVGLAVTHATLAVSDDVRALTAAVRELADVVARGLDEILVELRHQHGGGQVRE